MKRAIVLGLILLLTVACGAPEKADPVDGVAPTSDSRQTGKSPEESIDHNPDEPLETFINFTYNAFAAEGFCPNNFLEANISRRSKGELVFSATVVKEAGESERQACLQTGMDACLVGVTLTPRMLDDQEVQAVIDTFTGLQFNSAPAWCEDLMYDPCLIERYQWDFSPGITLKAGVEECEEPHVVAEGHEAILALLNGLAEATAADVAIDGTRPKRCTAVNSYPSTAIWDMAFTPSGELWVASTESVGRYEPLRDTWERFGVADGLPGPGWQSVTIAESGPVWVTSWEENGAGYYDGQSWRTVTVADGLPSNAVNSIAIDHHGSTWFATDNGVASLAAGMNEWFYPAEFFPELGRRISDIVVTDHDTLWFFDSNANPVIGLGYDDGRAFEMLDERAISPGAVLDAERSEWIGTEGCFESPQSFAFSKAGELWIGTDRGVSSCPRPDDEDSRAVPLFFNKQDGLPSEKVMSLGFDEAGNLWVGTTAGLAWCEVSVQ